MSVPSTTAAKTKSLALGPMSKEGTVTIEIGPDHEKYYIHRALLVRHSEYFAKALRGSWKEAQEGIVKLEEVGTAEFNIFVHWLYSQKLPDPMDDGEWTRIMNVSTTSCAEDLVAKVRAYVVGERLLMVGFRCAMCEHISEGIWYSDSEVWYPAISYAFENLPSTSIMLRLLVDRFAEFWNDDEEDEEEEDGAAGLSKLPHAFIMRVMRRFSEMRNETNKKNMKERCYFEHTTDDEKKACLRLHMHYDGHKGYGHFY